MPLGASRVEGARPYFESYRYELWKMLQDSGYHFDFIGTRYDSATYPKYKGEAFDRDHEGHGGWTAGQIRFKLNKWINNAGVPDIVLFSSPAANDALAGLSYADAIQHVKAIIELLQEVNPDVVILIEEMAPAHSNAMTKERQAFFLQMLADVRSIAENYSTATSKVITVDMATGFKDVYLADAVHYNQVGATLVARRYFLALQPILNPSK